MKRIYTSHDNPLVDGIKIIGIGKHGSKPLPEELLQDILHYLENGEPVPIQKGAFFGALMAKGPNEKEQALIKALTGDTAADTQRLYDKLCSETPAYMKEIGVKLLDKEYLTKEEAGQLGDYLFSDEPGEAFRGMAASMLRIRYETDEEYGGLMEAATRTYTEGFQEREKAEGSLVQLSEPFDGVEHSYMITPVLAHALQKEGYPVVVSMGSSSGPKFRLNTLDLYQEMGGGFISSNAELRHENPPYGWALDQQILSPALDAWVERRRLIFKRPFLATLEKVLNPCHARILITSVFHITYMEKMIRLGGMAGFDGIIVLKRGLEGTLAPSLSRASGILCAARQADGSFLTHTIDADEERFSRYRADADEVIGAPTAAENLMLIQKYTAQGFSGNEDFDQRAGLAISLYKSGLEWINSELKA